MARSRDDLLKVLKDAGIGDDVVADIDALVDTEKQTGIKVKQKLDAEAKSLRDQVQKAAKHREALTKLGLGDEDDPDEFAETVAGKLKKFSGQQTPDEETTRQLRKLQQTIETERKARVESEKQRDEERNLRRTKILSDTVNTALTGERGPRFHAQDLLVKDLVSSGRVKLNDSDAVVWTGKNGEEVDTDSGVKALMVERKDLLANAQTGGAHTQSSTQFQQDDGSDAAKLAAFRRRQRPGY